MALIETVAAGLKRAMRGIGAPVTIVTAVDGGGRPYAMTASSFTSVSLCPPTVLVCVNREASIHDPLQGGRPFCVNALQTGHRELAVDCATQGCDSRFADRAWQLHPLGLPFLAYAQAAFFCETLERLEVGTHTVLVGVVNEVRTAPDIAPLIYVDGRFAGVRLASEEDRRSHAR